ncbi:MAG: aminotransferase class V-fold PLP-dependent enzyme, partial [Rhodothermia bacterium]
CPTPTPSGQAADRLLLAACVCCLLLAACCLLLAALLAHTDDFYGRLDDLNLSRLRGADFRALRDQYTLAPEITYLNHASIGTIPRIVQEAHRQYLDTCESNPWLYMWGGEWYEPRDDVRDAAAALLNCDAASIAITHNTTEAFNVLSHGLPLSAGDEVLFCSLNHDGASKPFEYRASERGFSVRRFEFPALDVSGMSVSDVVEIYDGQISDKTRLLVIPHIDNIVGLRHPIAEIAAAARNRGVEWIAVDGAQTVGMIDVDLTAMGADVFATSPHKWLQAPKGLGLAYYGERVREVLRPMWVTWGQKWFKDAMLYEDYGTRNMSALLALGDAIAFQTEISPTAREARLIELRELASALADSNANTEWRSPRKWDMGGSLYAIEIRGVKSADFAKAMFADRGFVFRSFEVGGVQTIRLSPNVFTSEAEIERLFVLISEN